MYQQSLTIRREIGEQHGMALSLNNLGNVSVVLGDLHESRDLFAASQDIFDQIGNRWGVATCLSNLANVDSRLGHFEDAAQVYESSLEIYREIGDRWGTANCLVGWAVPACESGRHDEAEGHLKEALSIAKEINAVPLIIHGVAGMAALLTRRGQREQAEVLIAVVLAHPAAEGEAREHVHGLLDEEEAARLEAVARSLHNPEARLDEIVQRLVVVAKSLPLSRGPRAPESLQS